MEKIHADLTIVGAGIAGMCAAMSAARCGLKVALITDRPVLGGNCSSEVRVWINGAATGGESASVYAREGGIVEELKQLMLRNNPGLDNSAMWDVTFFDWIYSEKNIDLYLNTVIFDVQVDNGEITSVAGVQTRSERQLEFFSPMFIDASGDGVVGKKTGALYMSGRESKYQYNESLAPEQADHHKMGHTLLFYTRDTGHKVEYKRPEFAHDITKLSFFKNLGRKDLHRIFYRIGRRFHSLWWLEYGGHLDTVRDNEEIMLELRKLVYGMWDYIKNSGNFEDTENLTLEYVAPLAGKRESRRFIGDYVLTQNDILNKTDFPDAVSIGGWPIDVHCPYGVYGDEPATGWNFVPGIYNLPFRVMYSKNIANLMLAGRIISCTQLAMGSTRIVATGACAGQTVGTAAWLCKKYGIHPRDITNRCMEELQDMLQKADQTILGRPEKSERRLLENMTLETSSHKRYCNEATDDLLALDRQVGIALPVSAEQLESVQFRFKNTSEEEVSLDIDIYGGSRPENYLCTKHMKKIRLVLPAAFDGWKAVDVCVERPEDQKVYIVFNREERVALYAANGHFTGVVSFASELEAAAKEEDLAQSLLHRLEKNISFRNVVPEQELYTGANVVNGFSRPYGLPNLWISEKAAADREEFIALSFEQPQRIEEIHLLFNTALEKDIQNKINAGLIKAYHVEVTDKNGESKVIDVYDNIHRLRIHELGIEDAVKLKITFDATYGSQYYQVYGIKLF